MELDLKHQSDSLMLLDIFPQSEKTDNGYKNILNIIYKDMNTGKKYLDIIENPKVPLYFTKKENRGYNHNRGFAEYDECFVKDVSATSINYQIAKTIGGKLEEEYNNYKNTGNWKQMRNMQMCPYVFGADIPPDVVYRRLWLDKYENDKPKKISKGYADIEVDTIDSPGLPEYGTCPINAVSVIDEDSKQVFVLLLRNSKNPQIAEFEKNIGKFIKELHDDFDEFYGVFDYKFYMYDDERELIKDLFRLINTVKMDIILWWNGGGFDIPYIIERIKTLGMDPDIVMTHPDFPIRRAVYKKDEINFKVANKSDSFVSSSYTKHIDHMVLYAATRKGQSELRSNSLSYIAQIELNDDKLDYSEVANMSTFPYENYAKFVKYNIKDTLLQYGIERRTSDVDGLYLRSYSTLTTYDKVFKQTVALRNRAYYEFHLQNIILGVNVNAIIGKKSDRKFTGAIVGDPELNSFTGKSILGKLSKYIYDNVIDMDFSSMYPHIILAFNIERHTMIGKLQILTAEGEQVSYQFKAQDWMVDDIDKAKAEFASSNEDDEEDDEFDDRYDAGKDFMDNYLTGDLLALGTKWFDLPTTEYIVDSFKKKTKRKDMKQIKYMNPAKRFVSELRVRFMGEEDEV